MSDVVAAVRPDCPRVPDDAQWNEMYQTELLCGKEGESRLVIRTLQTAKMFLTMSGNLLRSRPIFQMRQFENLLYTIVNARLVVYMY